ncbi:GerAB/ArcD/ProY family transporter [Cohnella fermenti]|uniref:Spore gernimation protein n=1 Tax=Cohnella fermenti TaxID=2565925 RepID=A0A4S4C5W3_9BACL|nr:endospore germination permease [Cohnella fermenti]THF83231.1 spore gernimation protein [Cohnella fermenti]
MNQPSSIGSVQMASLFLFFMTGSSIVLVPSPLTHEAGAGAWISLLLAWCMGAVYLACILYLYRKHPDLSLVGSSRLALGKLPANLLMIPVVVLMFWNVAGIVSEIGLFFRSTMLKETPTYVVNSLMFVMISLTARAGIVVIARMSALLLAMMVAFIVVVLLLVWNLYEPDFLLPILPNGMGPVLHAAYIVYGFPYSELIVFAFILPLVRREESHKVRKHLYIALSINGLLLMLSVIGSLMVLGPLTGDLKYSLFQLARLIFVREIIERIESIIGFSLIVGFYFKASILLFILVRTVAEWLNLRDEKLFTLPIAFVCLLLSVTTYTQEASLDEMVNVVWPLLNNLCYVLPMLAVAAVTLVRRQSPPDASRSPE